MDEVPAIPFRRSFRVGWGDLDSNGHMANRAYLDHAADSRLAYFAERGFPVLRLAAERFGPIIVRDELVYRKELLLLEEFVVELRVAGFSADDVRFLIENTFRNAAGDVAAVVTSEGLWFDLDRRHPRTPPAELAAAFRAAPRTESFRELPARRTPG